jgi:hypothetical protein
VPAEVRGDQLVPVGRSVEDQPPVHTGAPTPVKEHKRLALTTAIAVHLDTVDVDDAVARGFDSGLCKHA